MIILTTILLLAAAASAQELPEITFYGLEGNFTYTNDEPKLNHTTMTDACKTGVWIRYTGWDWWGGTTTIFPYVNDTCHQLVRYAPEVGSARLAGFRPDYDTPSITLFSGNFFSNSSLVFGSNGVSNITMAVNSVISINSHLELFREPNYSGDSFCIVPQYCEDGGVCHTWNLLSVDNPWDITQAKSARFGCAPESKKLKISPPHNLISPTSISL